LAYAQDAQGAATKAAGVKAQKSDYRDAFAELQAVKSEMGYAQQLVEQCKAEIVADFNAWHQESSPPDVPSPAPPAPAAAETPVKPAKPPLRPADYNLETQAFYDAQLSTSRAGSRKSAAKLPSFGHCAERVKG